MRKLSIYSLASLLFLVTIFTSCDAIRNANNTQKGATIGATSGAVIGGIIGNNVGNKDNSALGAILGGVIGGATGAAIGNKMDKQAQEIEEVLPSAEVERVGEGIKLTLGEDAVRFDFNKSTLTSQAKTNLDKLVPVFKDYNNTDIIIYGYTDSKGSDEYNLGLSEKRATSVKSYLAANGITSSRIQIKGMGEADPIATNDTDEGRSINRRVEFAIIANDDMVKEVSE